MVKSRFSVLWVAWAILLNCVIVYRIHAEVSSKNVLVGVMEDDPTELANWKQGPSKNRVIRPLFEKQNGEWKTSTFHQEEINWTLAFDGKNKGTVKIHPNSNDGSLNTDSHLTTTTSGQFLILGKPSIEFSGWENTLVNRPIVLVSNGGFRDPDEWKPIQPTENQIKRFKTSFHKEFPNVLNCDKDEKPLPNPTDYNESDIKINKVYRSNKGDLLATMNLQGSQCGMSEGPFLQQTFLFRPDNSSTHLSLGNKVTGSDKSAENSMRSLFLVDAGDYDGDGVSEVVFFISGYNEDGYAMFYDSFKKNVMWTWHYH